MSTRTSWLDESDGTVLITEHARRLDSFISTMADGVVDEAEIAAQEARLVELMKRIEPQLDDALHALVTELLCEQAAYDIMQMMRTAQEARGKVAFRG